MARVAPGRPFPPQETDRSMRRCLSHGLATFLVLLSTALAAPGAFAAPSVLADKLVAEAPRANPKVLALGRARGRSPRGAPTAGDQ